MPPIELAAAISSLREELLRVACDGRHQRLRFKPAEVELTVNAEISTGGTGRAGIRWLVLEAGAEVSRRSLSTQTVTLKFQPVLLDDQNRPVDLFISDEESPDEVPPGTASLQEYD